MIQFYGAPMPGPAENRARALMWAFWAMTDLQHGSVVNLVDRVKAAPLGPKTTAWLEGQRARDAWKRVAAQG